MMNTKIKVLLEFKDIKTELTVQELEDLYRTIGVLIKKEDPIPYNIPYVPTPYTQPNKYPYFYEVWCKTTGQT